MDTDKKAYAPGNVALLTMFTSQSFNKEVATRLLAEIPDLNEPILNLQGHSSTYLFEAESSNNVEAVRVLLENGADPNLYVPDIISDCALTDLHFLWDFIQDDYAKRLEITKLFFEFGGDPNLWYEYETLYDHILWEVFNEGFIPHDWDYICSFFIILIAYGGGGGRSLCSKPTLAEAIDKNRIDEYKLKLFLCDDRYHLEGHLFNPDGVDIGIV